MNVLFMKRESSHRELWWQVTEGDKWWTVTWDLRIGRYFIMSGTATRGVQPSGRLGKKIIAAVEAAR